MEPEADSLYEKMRRRLARRAALVSAASLGAVMTLLLAVTPGSAMGDDLAPAATLAPDPPAPCTGADLAKPRMADMPIPQVVTTTLVVHPAPDVERLSPPASHPSVSAADAWATARRHGFGQPSSAGSAQIMLGQLYAATPAVVQSDRTSRPVYTHTLVWAVFGAHQPEPAVGTGAPCYFESTMLYVDATTGRPLVGEVFRLDGTTFTAGA